jgi:DNA polymerase family A
MTTAIFSSWQHLPFEEIWVADTEYYPGPGYANGGRDGDAVTPLSIVAIELRSSRVVRQWHGEFSAAAPYRLDGGALFVGFMNTAEFGFHLALGWGKPAASLDLYIEHRHHTNNGAAKAADRGNGFYSLAGALQYYRESGIDTAHKTDMRERILAGPPFTSDERARILEYNEGDTRATARLLHHIAPTIRSLPHAIARSDFAWLTAQQERRGVPVSLSRLEPIKAQWGAIRTDMAIEKDRDYGCYEIAKGEPHWRRQRFADYVKRNRMAWPTHSNGSLDEREQTFRDMTGRYPQVETLRELRYSLSKLRLNSLAIGSDGRNRTLLGPYGTKTGRNAPSTTRFIFGPAKWMRFMIGPPPGRVLVHRDYMQQEVRIAAVLSRDSELLAACEDDVYLGIAGQLGFVRESMSTTELGNVRTLFKTVVLGVQYGLGPRSLALRTGISMYEACEILARLRARFHAFESYVQRVTDHAGITLGVSTVLGWTMQCPPGINPRTVRNFPIQSTASEILHVACALAERRGVEIVAPVHDAIMAEGPADRADEIAAALDQAMRDAGTVVLRGYELPTDKQVIQPGEHFFDKRGKEMWDTIAKLLVKLEARRA